MSMNRRNVLIGLGAVAAGGGAVLGSGAFSQVDAERSVSVATTGDGSALVTMSVDESNYAALTSSSGDEIVIDAGSLNLDAITRLNAALTITPDASAESTQGPWTIDVLDDFGGPSITGTAVDTTSGADNVQLVFNSSASNSNATDQGDGSATVNSNQSVVYDLIFNLRGVTSTGAVSLNLTDDSIVIQAD